MGYKLKTNKSVKKRFKVSKTGKLKRGHSNTSHLMSARSPAKKRHLRKSEILFEGLAKNMRKMMGLSGLKPKRTAHLRALAAKKAAKAAAAGETATATK